MRKAALALIILLSCCVTEENAPAKVGNTWCDRLAECDQGDFDRRYNSHRDCVDDFDRNVETWQACRIDAGCVFVPQEVTECRAELRDASCDEIEGLGWLSLCTDSYDCTDTQSFAAGVCTLRGGP